MRLTRKININAPIEKVFSIIEENKEVNFWREDLIRPADNDSETIQPKQGKSRQQRPAQTHTKTKDSTEESMGRMKNRTAFKGEITAYNKPYSIGVRIQKKGAQLLSNIELSEVSAGTEVRFTSQIVLSSRHSALIIWFSKFATKMMMRKHLKQLKEVAEGERSDLLNQLH